MVLVIPFLLWGIFFAILIWLVHSIVRYFLRSSLDSTNNFQFLWKDSSSWLVIQYFISGFLIEIGMNFLSAIIFPPHQSFPIIITIQEAEFPFFLFGGLIMILYPVYEIFHTELLKLRESQSLSKDEINDNIIKLSLDYTRYKENTQNPKLSVIKISDDGIILVNAPDGTRYLTKNLMFSLHVEETLEIEGVHSTIDSLELADCTFSKSGGKTAYFTTSNWSDRTESQEKIQKLMANSDFKILNPFIKLSDNEIAEKFSHSEMKSYLKTRQKLKMINEENCDDRY
ncbi:MAG: hypothetical protein WC367_00985 [Methanoregula sp.]|jgi:hypothetical protein